MTEISNAQQLAHEEDAEGNASKAPSAFSQSNFQRIEKKYLIDDDLFAQLMARIGSRFEYDAYGKSLISSLYYDTPEQALINRSLEKPLYKEKLRVRMYGSAQTGDPVYVELKKKFKGVVYKRRVAMTASGAAAFMNGMPYEDAMRCFPLSDRILQAEAFAYKAHQIADEIAFTKSRIGDLAPAMMIITNRVALRSNDGSDVRITFDIDPVWRTYGLNFESGFSGEPLLPGGALIMEIKCPGAYPLWLSEALGECRIYPQSCSKYGIAYQKVAVRMRPSARFAPSAVAQRSALGGTPSLSQSFSLRFARLGL